jgi:hypothetical protein
MRDAILEALCPPRRKLEHQVILVTDGIIGIAAEVAIAHVALACRPKRASAGANVGDYMGPLVIH